MGWISSWVREQHIQDNKEAAVELTGQLPTALRVYFSTLSAKGDDTERTLLLQRLLVDAGVLLPPESWSPSPPHPLIAVFEELSKLSPGELKKAVSPKAPKSDTNALPHPLRAFAPTDALFTPADELSLARLMQPSLRRGYGGGAGGGGGGRAQNHTSRAPCPPLRSETRT